MQSYLKYKAYYDRKTKAAPLTSGDYCFIFIPKADTQATKIPFREFRWVGPYKIEKVSPNNNYIVRRLGTKLNPTTSSLSITHIHSTRALGG